jgi:DNA-binding GntR family transcriptional regulator
LLAVSTGASVALRKELARGVRFRVTVARHSLRGWSHRYVNVSHQGANGRPSSQTATNAVPPGGRRAFAYEQIRRLLLDAQVKPGEALSEYQLAKALHVSRTPIREALRQLEREGLVRSIPQKGVLVQELFPQDIVEIYVIRELLEGFAARVAALALSDEATRELSESMEVAARALSEGRVDEALESDERLHTMITTATRNRRLDQILATLDDQVHRLRHLSAQVPGRLESTIHEHMEIAEAIRRRDPDEASQAMVRHLRLARDNALSLAYPASPAPPVVR